MGQTVPATVAHLVACLRILGSLITGERDCKLVPWATGMILSKAAAVASSPHPTLDVSLVNIFRPRVGSAMRGLQSVEAAPHKFIAHLISMDIPVRVH